MRSCGQLALALTCALLPVVASAQAGGGGGAGGGGPSGASVPLVRSPVVPFPQLSLWHAYRGAERAALEKVVARYNARPSAQAKVVPLAIDAEGMGDRIAATVPRGSGPDLFIFGQDRLGGWVEAGDVLEPADPWVAGLQEDSRVSRLDVRTRFDQDVVGALTYRGRLWALPLNEKAVALIYNRKLVPAPPRTSAEMVALARKLTDPVAGRYGLAFLYSNLYYDAAVFNGFGGGVLDGRGAPALDSPENVRAFELVMRWKRDGVIPAELSATLSASPVDERAARALVTSLFDAGKVAMVIDGPWLLADLGTGVDVGVAPLPVLGEAGSRPMRPWVTVEGIFVTAQCRDKDAAFDFARFLTDVEAARTLALEGRQTPAALRAFDDPRLAGDEVLAGFRRQVEAGIHMPNAPEMTLVYPPASVAIESMIRGTPPREALGKAQTAAQRDVRALRRR
ncbi:MAG: extracellular solute-binding protein [Anaeromyxobacter sp.]